MKHYDLIVVGSGSAMNLVDPMLQQNPRMKVAAIHPAMSEVVDRVLSSLMEPSEYHHALGHAG